MNRSQCNLFLPFLLLLLGSPLTAQAIPAITCHCFTERAFNPAKPAVADPYFLATTQNSFFAAVFNVDKKGVVMLKQQGVSADDLWVAYRLSQKTGRPAESLLQARKGKGGWKEALAPLALPLKTMGPAFVRELNAGTAASGLARIVVDELLVSYRLMGEAELAILRRAGASHQELILAALLAARTGQPARKLYFDVSKGAATWGALLQGGGLDPAAIHQEISTLVQKPR